MMIFKIFKRRALIRMHDHIFHREELKLKNAELNEVFQDEGIVRFIRAEESTG